MSGKTGRLVSNIGIVESKKYPDRFHKRDEYGDVDESMTSSRESAERWAAGRRKVVKQMITREKMKAAAKAELLPPPKGFKVITADQARGDSRPVSVEEFNRLARRGQEQLDQFAKNASPIDGLDRDWDSVKRAAWTEAQKSWGGATIDAHTGKPLSQGENKYAITVKGGRETVSVPDSASQADFDTAMGTAKERFRDILERESHYLGVFHDDDTGRIDIDPVLVVSKSSDVETIGAASYSIGGAYNFRDGLGYWPPHVDTSPTATRNRDDYERTYEE